MLRFILVRNSEKNAENSADAFILAENAHPVYFYKDHPVLCILVTNPAYFYTDHPVKVYCFIVNMLVCVVFHIRHIF